MRGTGFFSHTLDEILKLPKRIHLVVRSPGSGKTKGALKALAERLKAQPEMKILVAVHSTDPEKRSNAKSIQEDLLKLGVSSTIILGEETLATQKAHLPEAERRHLYQEQFPWEEGIQVKIISHSHLPLLFGRPGVRRTTGPLSHLLNANLLMVDEDPTHAFVLSSPTADGSTGAKHLNLSYLTGSTSKLAQAIQKVLQDIEKHPAAHHSRAESWASLTETTYSISGSPFFQLLEPHLESHPLTPTDIREFRQDLKRLGHPQWVADAFEKSFQQFDHDPRHTPLTFGVTWSEPTEQFPETKTLKPTLRYDLNQAGPESQFDVPTFILDAYGEPEHYEAVLGKPVQLHPDPKPYLPQVHVYEDIKLDHQNIQRGRSQGQLRTALKEALQFASSGNRKLLLLTQKSILDIVKAEMEKLEEYTWFRQEGGTVEYHHWGAGRGLNEWRLFHVVALTPFRLPNSYQHHTLTAVYPSSSPTDQKKRVERRLRAEQDEILQMLMRGRQGDTKTATRKTAVFGVPIEKLDPARMRLQPASPVLPFKKQATRADSRVALHQTVQDLSKILNGGVPLPALWALGILKTPVGKTPLAEQASQQLKDIIKSERVKKYQLPQLEHWGRHDSLPNHPTPLSSRTEILSEQIEQLGKGLQAWAVDIRHPLTRKKTTIKVYAKNHKQARQAASLLGFEEG